MKNKKLLWVRIIIRIQIIKVWITKDALYTYIHTQNNQMLHIHVQVYVLGTIANNEFSSRLVCLYLYTCDAGSS